MVLRFRELEIVRSRDQNNQSRDFLFCVLINIFLEHISGFNISNMIQSDNREFVCTL